ncbi:MAG: DUF4190 domain-containing protein [Tepidisphaeraceae bacterium]
MSEPPVAAPEFSPAISERAPWSIVALAGFACGVFLIVPFVAGIAAVVLGILGLRDTREPSARGRRLAVAAIVLGLVNIVAWGGYAQFISRISAPGRSVAHRFVTELNAGKTTDAERDCAPSISAARLQAAADQLSQWGGAKSIAVLHINSDTANGATTGSVRGSIHTPRGEHLFQLQTFEQDGVWKVADFSIQ